MTQTTLNATNTYFVTIPNDEAYDLGRLHKLLLAIGVPPNIYGYSYIIRSIELILSNPEYMHYRVERAIRHAINTAWINNYDEEFMKTIFQNCIRPNKKVPSNSVFLSRLYYYIINNYQ